MKTSTQTKFESIRRDLAGKRVIVAFSGGVDSTVLASVASEVASEIRLLTISSPTVPKNELADARSIAEELGLELIVEEFDWLEEERLASNNVERCFYCKEILVDLWLRTAKEIERIYLPELKLISENIYFNRYGMTEGGELIVEFSRRYAILIEEGTGRISLE